MKQRLPYQGVEQGPIRPPSEAESLCLRVTRNCPWNRCAFCSLYKDETFTVRSVDDVIQDIDTIYTHVERLRQVTQNTGRLTLEEARYLRSQLPPEDRTAFVVALNWYVTGMKSVFLQDANSLVIKPANLVRILQHLNRRFPGLRRITSYARSQTIAKMKAEDLRAIREAGLDRIHIGMESGSDEVLAMISKGATKAMHITAGVRAKTAGMELSEYYMPGLGGQAYSATHALESADALNQINPDFIRLRTLVIPPSAPLYSDYRAGRFRKCADLMVVSETRLFIEHLQGVNSTLKSDHIINLLPELEGRLPDDKPRLLATLQAFLAAGPERQRLYQVGRRCGFLSRLAMLDDPVAWANAEAACQELGVTAENVDAVTEALLQRYI